jgi:hypothetical protein
VTVGKMQYLAYLLGARSGLARKHSLSKTKRLLKPPRLLYEDRPARSRVLRSIAWVDLTTCHVKLRVVSVGFGGLLGDDGGERRLRLVSLCKSHVVLRDGLGWQRPMGAVSYLGLAH